MDPYRTRGDTPFDFRRHFGEFLRWVLPIFVLVGAGAMLFFLLWGPEPEEGIHFADRPPARVGLLPVEGKPVTGPDQPTAPLPFDPAFVIPRPLDLARAPRAVRFDAPMGSPLGALTYNAQPFLTTRHLGDDLNGIGGWNSDLGDPVYAAGDGEVVYAGWPSDGWGNVVMLLHRLADGKSLTTFYGHLDRIQVPVGAVVRRGETVGTVGTANGRYLAHLHFEVRPVASLSPGAGYADGPLGRLAGEPFVLRHRGAPETRQNGALGGELSAGPGEDDSGSGPASLKIRTEEPVP